MEPPRIPYSIVGPFYRVDVDGHEELYRITLRFYNTISVLRYGPKDSFRSSTLTTLVVSKLLLSDGGHTYLDEVLDNDCMADNVRVYQRC